ncbi:MAG: spore coat protein U domain-containing protein [Nitrospira sp.]|nr:spore coat protein U domain-containing protein [Nitrospira sp.]
MMRHVVSFMAGQAFVCMTMVASSYGGSVSTTLPVHVTVAPQCSVSTNGMEFGVFHRESVTGKGSIDIACHRGIDYHVTLGAGAHYEPGTHTRHMEGSSPRHKLSYRLYQDVGHFIEWGDRGYANTFPEGVSIRGTGTNQKQSLVIYGQIPASNGQLPAGSYSDTVLVTLHF